MGEVTANSTYIGRRTNGILLFQVPVRCIQTIDHQA